MTDNEKELFEALRDKRLWQANMIEGWSMKGVKKLQTDKYSEEVHFIYELLQNADDAEASYVKIELRDDRLLFVHNGHPFTITDDGDDVFPHGDLNQITAPAPLSSSKENKIGKFGIGFRSVYIYCEEPEIYGDPFSFKIKGQMVPELIENKEYCRAEGETLFVLRFRDKKNYEEIDAKLKTLESPILFLNHLGSITWTADGISHSYTKRCESIKRSGNISVDYVTETNDAAAVNYYMFSKTIHLDDKGDHRIYAAFPLKKEGGLAMDYQKVYCFFKTMACFGMVAKLQAPFLLTESREQLLPNSSDNEKLIAELATLMSESLFLLTTLESSKKKLIDGNLFKIIPYDYREETRWGQGYTKRGVTQEKYISCFYRAFVDLLKTKAVFLSRDGIYRDCSHVFITDNRIRKLLNKQQLDSLLNDKEHSCEFLAYSVEYDKKCFLEKIGVKTFGSKELANKITSSFMDEQTEEWVDGFYEYLSQQSDVDFDLYFQACPVVKLKQGRWVPMFTDKGEFQVFAPWSENMHGENEGRWFIDYNFYKRHQSYFDKKGVHTPNRKDFLNEILQKYSSGDADLTEVEIAQDFNLILMWLKEEGKKDEHNQILSLLKAQYRIKVKYNSGRETMVEPQKAHIYSADIEKLSKATGIDYPVVKEQLYQVLNADNKRLLETIGVKTEPQPFEKISYDAPYDLSDYWLNKIEEVDCFNFYGLTDYVIPNFTTIQFSSNLSKFIWNSLCNSKIPFKNAVLKYKKKYKRSSDSDEFQSTLIRDLRKTAWVVNKTNRVVTPSDISVDEFHQLGYVKKTDLENLIGLGANVEAQKEINNKKIAELFNGDFESAKECYEIRKICAEQGVSLSDALANLTIGNKEKNRSCVGDGFEAEDEALPSDDIVSYSDEDYNEPSCVRKTEHYIGVKLYEEYLNRGNVKYIIPNETGDDDSAFDIKIEHGEWIQVVTIKSYKEKEENKHGPLSISAKQHEYLNMKGSDRCSIVRFSLKDLGLDFDKHIRDVYGPEADVQANEQFRKRCDKFVADYWKGKSLKDFARMISKYSVRIYREV